MGAGNTSVLMQLLVGMLDAALARQQDLVPEPERVAVALKVDEAPLVLNRGFAETMALKRSAGLETVACWQTDAQWIDRDVRDQLDALFAHRVYFATSSAEDARAAVKLTMAEFSDMVRPGIERISSLGHPDARLHLPKHHAIASWLTPRGAPGAVRRRDDPAARRSRAPARCTPPARPSAAGAISPICASRTGIEGAGAARVADQRERVPRTAPGESEQNTATSGTLESDAMAVGVSWTGQRSRRSRARRRTATASSSSSTAHTASAGPGACRRRGRWNPNRSTWRS